MIDHLGDRIKDYERVFTDIHLPHYARIDGRRNVTEVICAEEVW